MVRHVAVAYGLWLLGSWFGWHHLYLNRPEAAFLTTITFNGWGLGWLRDLFAIPQFVLEANAVLDEKAGHEWTDKLRVERRYHQRPAIAWLVLFIQVGVGHYAGVIGSSLVPEGLSASLYELLFVGSAAWGIKFTGEALDHQTTASYKFILAAMMSLVTLAYGHSGGDVGSAEYRRIKSFSVYAGCAAYVLTRRWPTYIDEALAGDRAKGHKQLSARSSRSFLRGILRYWLLLSTFLASGMLALRFHGDITIEVDGVETTQTFFEAAHNAWHSEAMQNLWETLGNLLHGRSIDEDFEERWQRFSVDIDLSGRHRHLKTLGLARTANAREIKAAYRHLVLEWHPDKYAGNDPEHARERFYEIQDAYERLVGDERDDDGDGPWGRRHHPSPWATSDEL